MFTGKGNLDEQDRRYGVIPLMNKIKYQDSVPIRPRQHTAWVIEIPDEPRRIAIWSEDATIEDVHDSCKARFVHFRIGQLGVGEYVIARTDHSYMDDARFVDQDWNMSLTGEDENGCP